MPLASLVRFINRSNSSSLEGEGGTNPSGREEIGFCVCVVISLSLCFSSGPSPSPSPSPVPGPRILELDLLPLLLLIDGLYRRCD